MKESNKMLKEYWVFIDDSGNVELSSSNRYFMYAAIIFDNYNNVEDFRENYKSLLEAKFKYELKKYKGEVKGKHRISFKKRKMIYDLITASKGMLVAVVEDKLDPYNVLLKIEPEYKANLKLVKGLPLKAQKAVRQIRKNSYGRHKSYLIGQLVCLIVQAIKITNRVKINLIIDNENLLTPGNNFDDFADYLKYEQKYLIHFDNEYTSRLEDSKKDYGLQAADFLAHAINKRYNENDSSYFDYINSAKKVKIKEFPYVSMKNKINKEIIINIDKKNKSDNI